MKRALVMAAACCLSSFRLLGVGTGIVFDDKSAFLALTEATPATAIPSTPYTFFDWGSGFTSGSLSFTLNAPDAIRFTIDDWTIRLPGNELAVSGPEEFNLVIDTGLIYAFGFDFVEPEFDPNVNGPFVDSTFTVTLKASGSVVDEFSFERPNDSAQFFGVVTGPDQLFDSVEIRETTGGVDNEFFGQFYTAVPEPGSVSILAVATITFLGLLRRKKTV